MISYLPISCLSRAYAGAMLHGAIICGEARARALTIEVWRLSETLGPDKEEAPGIICFPTTQLVKIPVGWADIGYTLRWKQCEIAL